MPQPYKGAEIPENLPPGYQQYIQQIQQGAPTGTPGTGGLPPTVTESQYKQYEQEAQQRLAAEAAQKQPAPAPTIDISQRQFTPDPSWTLTERNAQGNPTIYTDPEGTRHYSDQSTMWKMGYETSKEYFKPGGGYAVSNPVEVAPHVAVQTWDGINIHLTKEEHNELAELKGEQQFMEMQYFGLIDPKAEYDPKITETVKAKQKEYTSAMQVLSKYIDKETGEIDVMAAVASADKKVRQALYDVGVSGKEYTGYSKDIKEFEAGLDQLPQKLKLAYQKGGITGYNKAVEEHNKELAISNAEAERINAILDKLDKVGLKDEEGYYDLVGATFSGGVSEKELRYVFGDEAVTRARKLALVSAVYQPKYTTLIPKKTAEEARAITSEEYSELIKPDNISDEDYAKIKPYIQKSGTNVVEAINAGVPEEIILKVTGLGQEELKEARWQAEYNEANIAKQQFMLAKREPVEYSKTIGGIVGKMALYAIPVIGSYALYKEGASRTEMGISLAADMLIVVPEIKAISAAVKSGSSIGNTILKSTLRVARGTATAPYTMLRHPIATFKSMVEPIEMLFRAKHLPIAATWRGSYEEGWGIAKVLAGEGPEAMATRRAMEQQYRLLTEGKITAGRVEIPGFGELRFSGTGMQKEMPLLTFTATPYGAEYKGLGVVAKDEGIFTASQGLYGLDMATAAGKSPSYVFKGKTYIGKLDDTGQLLNTSNRVVGQLADGVKILDINGDTLGIVKGTQVIRDNKVVAVIRDGGIFAEDPKVIGKYYQGQLEHDKSGKLIGAINENGMLVNEKGIIVKMASPKVVGFIPEGSKVIGEAGKVVGTVKSQPAFVMIQTNGVKELPADIAKARNMKEMEDLAWKAFKSGQYTDELYPVFKQYARWIEDEGILPVGTRMIPVLGKDGKPFMLATRDHLGRKIDMPLMQLVDKKWAEKSLTITRELSKGAEGLEVKNIARALEGTGNIPKKSIKPLVAWLRQNKEATLIGSGAESVWTSGKIRANDWDIAVPKPTKAMGDELADIITSSSGLKTRVAVTKDNVVIEVLDKGLWKKAIDLDELAFVKRSPGEGLAEFSSVNIDGVNVQSPASQISKLYTRMAEDFGGKGYARWERFGRALGGDIDIGIGAKPPSTIALRRLQAKGIWNTVRDIFKPGLKKIERIKAAGNVAPDMADDIKKLITVEDKIKDTQRQLRAAQRTATRATAKLPQPVAEMRRNLVEMTNRYARQSMDLQDKLYTRAMLLASAEKRAPASVRKDMKAYAEYIKRIIDSTARRPIDIGRERTERVMQRPIRKPFTHIDITKIFPELQPPEERKIRIPKGERRIVSKAERAPRRITRVAIDRARLAAARGQRETRQLRQLRGAGIRGRRLTEYRTIDKTKTRETGKRARWAERGELRIPQKTLALRQGATDKEKREYINNANGAIAWRQGQLHGKPRWDVITKPYSKDEDYVMVLGKPPKGATIAVGGPKSAYRTAQMLYGKPPGRKVSVDSGFQDIDIISRGKRIKLHFKPDPELKTKGDITIGQHRERISERQPVISHGMPRISGRSVRLSPKMPRLR